MYRPLPPCSSCFRWAKKADSAWAIADGHHEASALCFKHIWQVCVDKLKDDLVIMVPAKDTILFAPASQKMVVEKMVEHGENAYEQSKDKVSKTLMRFSKDRKELTAYED